MVNLVVIYWFSDAYMHRIYCSSHKAVIITYILTRFLWIMTPPMTKQCEYVKYCCNGTITDGKFDYLNFEYCTMSTCKTFGALILSIVLIHSFLFIGNICDNYFAQTTGAIANLMGISHHVADAALGNGANDISEACAGLKNGGNQTLLILDDLLGGATFNPIKISALIVMAGRLNTPKMDKMPVVAIQSSISAVGCNKQVIHKVCLYFITFFLFIF